VKGWCSAKSGREDFVTSNSCNGSVSGGRIGQCLANARHSIFRSLVPAASLNNNSRIGADTGGVPAKFKQMSSTISKANQRKRIGHLHPFAIGEASLIVAMRQTIYGW
jgi:hypothetical protein